MLHGREAAEAAAGAARAAFEEGRVSVDLPTLDSAAGEPWRGGILMVGLLDSAGLVSSQVARVGASRSAAASG